MADPTPATHKHTLVEKWAKVSVNNKAGIYFSGVTMLATVVYCFFAGVQWYEIRKGSSDTHMLAESAKKQSEKAETISNSLHDAVDKMEKANAQAKVSLEQTLDQNNKVLNANIAASRLDQRAWIGVLSLSLKKYDADQPISVDVNVTNTGKTNAQNAEITLHIKTTPQVLTTLPAQTDDSGDERSNATIFPQGKLSSTVTLMNKTGMLIKPTEKDVELYVKGGVFVYVWADITYSDIFGKRHKTQFCNHINGLENSFIACKMHNEAD